MSKLLEALAPAFLDEDHWSGVRGLSEKYRTELRKKRASAPEVRDCDASAMS